MSSCFLSARQKNKKKRSDLLSARQKTNKKLRSLSGELPCPGPAEEVELCQVDISLITFFVGINFILIIIIITILSSL